MSGESGRGDSVVIDTDVLIWTLRGSAKAAQAVVDADRRAVSVITYMELLQGVQDKRELRLLKQYLSAKQFRLLPLLENIGHRALIYVEAHALSAGMKLADALIAATAVENDEPLLTANVRHYRAIRELTIKPFVP